MTKKPFNPTEEQRAIIAHTGSAFVDACPGSGKTRVLVERARQLLGGRAPCHAIALLSFTRAAITELEERLREEGFLERAVFPSFIATFDSFLWQFLIAPFGILGCAGRPHLIPDKEEREVRPYAKAQPLPLSCFDRATGRADPNALKRNGFNGKVVKDYETAAHRMRLRSLEKGELDFVDVRTAALARLRNPEFSAVLASAMASRFQEVIVDEAQDCSPADLEIIAWFRAARIPVKVICDPHQSIYGFRGGVKDDLFAFRETFQPSERLPMRGNFRSTRSIARSICALRVAGRDPDEALGCHRDEPTPVHIFSYPGQSVPGAVGDAFHDLIGRLDLDASQCPVLAATRLAGARAIGRPPPEGKGSNTLTCRLAMAICAYHFSFESGGRKQALEDVHRVLMEITGELSAKTYHQRVVETNAEPFTWRPLAIGIATALRYDPVRFATPEAWHAEARNVLEPLLPPHGPTINQRLPRNAALATALSHASSHRLSARTIHSVKGKQFPAVCVVLTMRTTKSIIDYLSTGSPIDSAEDARKLYVGASRAERLLAIASPKAQAPRLSKLLETTGASVERTEL